MPRSYGPGHRRRARWPRVWEDRRRAQAGVPRAVGRRGRGRGRSGPHAAATRRRASAAVVAGPGPYGALQAADANGIQLPAGFTSRLIGTHRPGGRRHRVQLARRSRRRRLLPGARRRLGLRVELRGGAAAPAAPARCASPPTASIAAAYRILAGTTAQLRRRAHAVGHLAVVRGERVRRARCTSATRSRPARASSRPLLGSFNHEAAAVDPVDRARVPHRGRPVGPPLPLHPDHAGRPRRPARCSRRACRARRSPGCPTSTIGPRPRRRPPPPFNGGEGAWIAGGTLWFTTKGDRRVWELDLATQQLTVLYDYATTAGAPAQRASTTSRATSRPATCTWPRTAGTWSSASSRRPTPRTRSRRSCASSATRARRSPGPPSRPTAPGSTSARSAAPTASTGRHLRDHRAVPHRSTAAASAAAGGGGGRTCSGGR